MLLDTHVPQNLVPDPNCFTLPTISPSRLSVSPGGNVPDSNTYNIALFDTVLDALTANVLTRLAPMLPRLLGVFHVITLSISPSTCTLNVRLELAISPRSLSLVAVTVNV